jgi:hypothetical protein
MPRLLVSVRGPTEALAAADGGAHLVDVTYPVSALGTPYPLNILAVRERLEEAGFEERRIASNIGARYADRASACQQALGVARAGVDVVRAGFAETTIEEAAYLGDSLVRTVRKWHPNTRVLPAVFVDEDMQRFFKPFRRGPDLTAEIDPDGLMVDTFNKAIGQGLLDYCSLTDIEGLADRLHDQERQLWVSGGITADELPALWETGADVVCVRVAACEKTDKYGRFGEVDAKIVRDLVATVPED